MSAFKAVTNITLSPELTQLVVGTATTFTATVTPSDATNQNIVWSRAEGVALSISQTTNGKSVTLTAGASGTFKLRATIANGVVAS